MIARALPSKFDFLNGFKFYYDVNLTMTLIVTANFKIYRTIASARAASTGLVLPNVRLATPRDVFLRLEVGSRVRRRIVYKISFTQVARR